MSKITDVDIWICMHSFMNKEECKESFTDMFVSGCKLLNLDDEKGAELFDVSIPVFLRWRTGKVVPPSANIVLRFMKEELEKL